MKWELHFLAAVSTVHEPKGGEERVVMATTCGPLCSFVPVKL